MPRTSSEWVVSDLSTVGPASLAANGDVQGNRARIAETGIKKDEATSIQSTARQIVPQTHVFELDRRKSIEARPSTTTRSRRQSNATLRPLDIGAAAAEGSSSAAALPLCRSPTASTKGARPAEEARHARRLSMRGPWFCSPLTLLTTAMAAICLFVIVSSFITRQKDIKGCRMSYMRPSFVQLSDFDTEHTRFASKYSLYLYREGGVDLDTKVR